MISCLRLQNFRSYTDNSFDLAPGVNIIVGPNASGKTNILESVLILAIGSSYRARDTELIRFDAPWARLDAEMPESRRVVKLQRDGGEKVLKSFEIDNHKLTRLMQNRTLPVVLFEPNHLQLLSGSPERRRNFLDDLIEQAVPGYGAIRRHYKRVLTHRNVLLKRQPRDLREQLFVWNIRLSELGGKMVRERSIMIDHFMESICELYSNLAGRDHAVSIRYEARFDTQQYESQLLQKLEASTDLDVLRGFTAYGPHREDFVVSIDGHAAHESASRGETRTLVLALKILELQLLGRVRGTPPLLLLDDVFSELDAKRRQALTRFVADYQTFITTTDADVVIRHFKDDAHIVLTLKS